MKHETEVFQDDMVSIANRLRLLYLEAKSMETLYWGEVSTDIAALAGGAAVTVATSLTKNEIVNGLTMCENIRKFFDNDTLAQANYMNTVQAIKYGNNTAGAIVTQATESFGDRLLVMANDITQLDQDCDIINQYYFDTEISAAVTALSTEKIVFGCDLTKDIMTAGVALVQEFRNLLNNGSVTGADYLSTLSKYLVHKE